MANATDTLNNVGITAQTGISGAVSGITGAIGSVSGIGAVINSGFQTVVQLINSIIPKRGNYQKFERTQLPYMKLSAQQLGNPVAMSWFEGDIMVVEPSGLFTGYRVLNGEMSQPWQAVANFYQGIYRGSSTATESEDWARTATYTAIKPTSKEFGNLLNYMILDGNARKPLEQAQRLDAMSGISMGSSGTWSGLLLVAGIGIIAVYFMKGMK